MATINQVKIQSPDGTAEIVRDIAVQSQNVTFQDGETLNDKLQNFTGATDLEAGHKGLVPAPAITDKNKYLKGDGTWDSIDAGVISVNTKTGAVNLSANDVSAIPATEKGSANGVAELDSTGKVKASQLPGSLGYVYEAATRNDFPATGDTNTMYVALDTNKVYRWGGTTYVEISSSLALGETETTAHRGDHGKIAYNHSQDANAISSAVVEGLYKIGGTAEGHISSLTPVTATDITALGIPDDNTTYSFTTNNVGVVTEGSELLFASRINNEQSSNGETPYYVVRGEEGIFYQGLTANIVFNSVQVPNITVSSQQVVTSAIENE